MKTASALAFVYQPFLLLVLKVEKEKRRLSFLFPFFVCYPIFDFKTSEIHTVFISADSVTSSCLIKRISLSNTPLGSQSGSKAVSSRWDLQFYETMKISHREFFYSFPKFQGYLFFSTKLWSVTSDLCCIR